MPSFRKFCTCEAANWKAFSENQKFPQIAERQNYATFKEQKGSCSKCGLHMYVYFQKFLEFCLGLYSEYARAVPHTCVSCQLISRHGFVGQS